MITYIKMTDCSFFIDIFVLAITVDDFKKIKYVDVKYKDKHDFNQIRKKCPNVLDVYVIIYTIS